MIPVSTIRIDGEYEYGFRVHRMANRVTVEDVRRAAMRPIRGAGCYTAAGTILSTVEYPTDGQADAAVEAAVTECRQLTRNL